MRTQQTKIHLKLIKMVILVAAKRQQKQQNPNGLLLLLCWVLIYRGITKIHSNAAKVEYNEANRVNVNISNNNTNSSRSHTHAHTRIPEKP